jgi:hypothetical protein
MARWREGSTIALPPHMSRGTDEWIWWQYSLFLLINRHCPDFFDDDVVSEHLQHVRANIPLPYD